MQKTWVQFLGWEDPLEKGKATHSSLLVRRITERNGNQNHNEVSSHTGKNGHHQKVYKQ